MSPETGVLAFRSRIDMHDQASTSSTRSSENDTDTVETTADGRFIKHKLSKLDTLAGLAIKYHVSVLDIKRANGLLSDTAMFAREVLLVPTKELPMGEEVQQLFATIVSGVGRDPLLNPDALRLPGSSAMALANSSSQASVDTGARSTGCEEASCGASCLPFGWGTADEVDGPPDSPYSRRSGSVADLGDVELMDRSPKALEGRGDDKVRRRRQESDNSAEVTSWNNNYTENTRRRPPVGPRPPPAGNLASEPTGPRLWSQITALSKSIGGHGILQKIYDAASQPALATPKYTSFADAADAVLTSFTPQRSGSSLTTQRRSSLSDLSSLLAEPSPVRSKDGPKTE